jgi:hypothetical protein
MIAMAFKELHFNCPLQSYLTNVLCIWSSSHITVRTGAVRGSTNHRLDCRSAQHWLTVLHAGVDNMLHAPCANHPNMKEMTLFNLQQKNSNKKQHSEPGSARLASCMMQGDLFKEGFFLAAAL